MVMEGKSNRTEDLSMREVGDLAWRYLRIPAALLVIEALYWFITIPSDTLAPIQVTEAWIWHNLTDLIYGEGATTFTTHNGWWTRVDLNNYNFPGGSIGLYVSDECAGVHEMLFISTLILMTDNVEWKLKMRSIAVMCGLVYILNITRLVVLYPLAVSSCANDPRGYSCAAEMWQFHTFVYQWGFLFILVLMWLVWFMSIGGPKRISAASKEDRVPLRISFRQQWDGHHWVIIIIAFLLIGIAAETSLTDDAFNSAQRAQNNCTAIEEYSPGCAEAEKTWNDEVGYVWSMATLGFLGIVGTSLEFSRTEKDDVEDDSEQDDLISEKHSKNSSSKKVEISDNDTSEVSSSEEE